MRDGQGSEKSSLWGVKGKKEHCPSKVLGKQGFNPWREPASLAGEEGLTQQAYNKDLLMSESGKQADLPPATHRTQAKQLEVTVLSAPTPTKQGQNSLERNGVYGQRP